MVAPGYEELGDDPREEERTRGSKIGVLNSPYGTVD
jgi:hypothetical protein